MTSEPSKKKSKLTAKSESINASKDEINIDNNESNNTEKLIAKTLKKIKKKPSAKYVETKLKKTSPRKKTNTESDDDESSESDDENKEIQKTNNDALIKKHLKTEEQKHVEKQNDIIELENCIIDFGNNMFKYLDANFSFIKIDDTFYIKGKDVAKFLEYVNPGKAIRRFVDNDEKITLEEIANLKSGSNLNLPSKHESKLLSPENLNENEKKTIYISESGLYELIFSSEMKKAKKFKKFVKKILLPTLRKTGTYTFDQPFLNTDTSYASSFFDSNDISNYKKCNVVYIGVVGISENRILGKYGKTGDIKKRLSEHKADFGENFKLIFVGKTNNNGVVENEFRDYIKSKGLEKKMVFNSENKTELFLTRNDFTLETAKETMINFIKKNPTDESRELELVVKDKGQIMAIEFEKTKQSEAKAKQEFAKIKQQEEITKQQEEITKQQEEITKQELAKAKQQEEITKQMAIKEKAKQTDLNLILLLKSNPEIKKIMSNLKVEIEEKNESDEEENENESEEKDVKDKKKKKTKATEKKNKKEKDTVFVSQFLQECTEEGETNVHCATLYNKYKSWFKNKYPKEKIPGNKIFIANLRTVEDVDRVYVNNVQQLGLRGIIIKDD